jgi:hypothetical protein
MLGVALIFSYTAIISRSQGIPEFNPTGKEEMYYIRMETKLKQLVELNRVFCLNKKACKKPT